ncbi:MAG: hypothetical protein IPJ88_11865 [Myxococcales bacterium]|nr:MAG: hypothetical protein IPJ88_11865 [Myxococcales bacterium]
METYTSRPKSFRYQRLICLALASSLFLGSVNCAVESHDDTELQQSEDELLLVITGAVAYLVATYGIVATAAMITAAIGAVLGTFDLIIRGDESIPAQGGRAIADLVGKAYAAIEQHSISAQQLEAQLYEAEQGYKTYGIVLGANGEVLTPPEDLEREYDEESWAAAAESWRQWAKVLQELSPSQFGPPPDDPNGDPDSNMCKNLKDELDNLGQSIIDDPSTLGLIAVDELILGLLDNSSYLTIDIQRFYAFDAMESGLICRVLYYLAQCAIEMGFQFIRVVGNFSSEYIPQKLIRNYRPSMDPKQFSHPASGYVDIPLGPFRCEDGRGPGSTAYRLWMAN